MPKLPLGQRVPGRSNPIETAHRVQRSLGLLAGVTAAATVAYWGIGLDPVDALYQTIITISTVGYEEVGNTTEVDDGAYLVITLATILAGVGTAFYTLGVLLESLVEGRLTDQLWRRRMDRRISDMDDHVIVCGLGRVGRTIADHVHNTGRDVVVIDVDEARFEGVELPFIHGDATDDGVLEAAGLERAGALVAALDTDAANLYVTLSGRSRSRDLFIVARARVESAEPKLAQAGADRVVNPQQIGGARIAAMILQPSVADFLDGVMHDGSLEFRLAEVPVAAASPMIGRTLRNAQLRDSTGALVLAMRDTEGTFRTNPPPDTEIRPGDVLIAIGTAAQLRKLADLVEP